MSHSKSTLADFVVRALEKKCHANKDHKYLPNPSEGKAGFYSVEKHPFTLQEYVSGLVDHLPISKSVYISAFIYLDRITFCEPTLKVSAYNVHRLFLICLMLAHKFLDEEILGWKWWVEMGGLEDVQELNLLEKELLQILDYRLAIGPSLFSEYMVTSLITNAKRLTSWV